MDGNTRIVEWLSCRGLGHLAETFVENEIDLDVLFDLTDDELREMGLSLGARKRFRAAINACASEPTELEPVESTTDTVSQAERRHLTIMFVDLVGSTELSGQLLGSNRSVHTDQRSRLSKKLRNPTGSSMAEGLTCLHA